MGSETRNQEYTYQYKSVMTGGDSPRGTLFCGYGPNIQINLPDNFLAMKAINIRIQAVFDPAETNPGFESIYLNGIAGFSYFYQNTTTVIPVKWMPNPTTHILDVKIDISSFIPKLYIFPAAAGNAPYFVLGLGCFGNKTGSLFSSFNGNYFKIWKIDYIYTTQGIR